MKELINLTFNLQHYTLIQDFSSKENIGKTHLLNKLGGMSEEEMEKTDFASVGRELINSGTGKITEYGLLFENTDVPLEEVYDGQVFPLYVYKDCVAIVGIKFKEKTEYAYLPCDDIEFDNAVKRLGAYTLDQCEIGLAEINITDKRCCDCFKEVFMNEDIYSVNLLAAALDGVNNYEKLSAAIEFAYANDSKSLSTIGKEKYIEFFDSEGALAISATIDNIGTIKNICTRCGRIVQLHGAGAIEVNVTTPLGAPAYFKVYAYD